MYNFDLFICLLLQIYMCYFKCNSCYKILHLCPTGVIPFDGFSMYVAPLCFLYNEPSKLYSVFREMYIRYFFRLHSISSHPSGLVSLCLQFERLLQTQLPQLFYHLREIGAQPLRIAFKSGLEIATILVAYATEI
nr:TBC1 domain family member 19-like [Misgurnus anguillicaudatus]